MDFKVQTKSFLSFTTNFHEIIRNRVWKVEIATRDICVKSIF